MKSKILLFVVLATIFMLGVASAEVPKMINYQGKLTNTDGTLIDTTISMTFSIYPDSIGTDSLWSETQSSVVVENGVFSVLLGSANEIPYSVFDGSVRYLGVKVGNDSEMVPRRAIMSVGYAYRSVFADTAGYTQSGIPSGVIVMWSGSIANIPAGWALCDGTNGTPDLRDKFIKSVPNASTNPGQTGGASTHDHGAETGNHTLTIAEMPAHNHFGTFGRYCQVGDPPNIAGYGNIAVDPYTVAVPSQGGDQPHSHPISADSNLPPYYELAFIMKL
jgi:hypothetical protein